MVELVWAGALRGRRRREGEERRMRKGRFEPIYKEKSNRKAQKKRMPNDDYPTNCTPRFSEGH